MKRRELLATTAAAALPVPASTFPNESGWDRPRGEAACDYLINLVEEHVDRTDKIDDVQRNPAWDEIQITGFGTPPFPVLNLPDDRVESRCIHIEHRQIPGGFSLRVGFEESRPE